MLFIHIKHVRLNKKRGNEDVNNKPTATTTKKNRTEHNKGNNNNIQTEKKKFVLPKKRGYRNVDQHLIYHTNLLSRTENKTVKSNIYMLSTHYSTLCCNLSNKISAHWTMFMYCVYCAQCIPYMLVLAHCTRWYLGAKTSIDTLKKKVCLAMGKKKWAKFLRIPCLRIELKFELRIELLHTKNSRFKSTLFGWFNFMD